MLKSSNKPVKQSAGCATLWKTCLKPILKMLAGDGKPKKKKEPTWLFLIWFFVILAGWLVIVLVFPIFGTGLVFRNNFQKVIEPYLTNVTSTGHFECGVGSNDLKYKCTWKLQSQHDCELLSQQLVQFITDRDSDYNLAIGVGFPLMGFINALCAICVCYAIKSFRISRKKVHSHDRNEYGMLNSTVYKSQPLKTMKAEQPKPSYSKMLLQNIYDPIEWVFGYLWERIPETQDTLELRKILDFVTLISVLVTGAGFIGAVEVALMYYSSIGRYMQQQDLEKLADQQPQCFLSGQNTFSKSTVQAMVAVVLAIGLVYFITAGSISAYRKAMARIDNYNMPLDWTFTNTWLSFFTLGAALYLINHSMQTDVVLATIPEAGKPLYVVLCLLLILTVLAESFALEYIAQLGSQGDLMPSKFEIDPEELRPANICARKSQRELQLQDYDDDNSKDCRPKKQVPTDLTMMEFREETLQWYTEKIELLDGRVPMLLMCKSNEQSYYYHAIIQPLGARTSKIGVTSFRYDLFKDQTETIKLQLGKVTYILQVNKTAVMAMEYAFECKQWVWCDAISVTLLRGLDRLLGLETAKQAFTMMGEVYRVYACIPSLNWHVDPLYCQRGWMLQEYICGELWIGGKPGQKDEDTLNQILKKRKQEKMKDEKILKRKQMTTDLIGELLESAVQHYQTCKVSEPGDLSMACFGLLISYGLFDEPPEENQPLSKFAKKSVKRAEFSLHPFRLLMRLCLGLLHQKRGKECAVEFANSERGQKALSTILSRPPEKETQETAPESYCEGGWGHTDKGHESKETRKDVMLSQARHSSRYDLIGEGLC
jgi:hypothetical protein